MYKKIIFFIVILTITTGSILSFYPIPAYASNKYTESMKPDYTKFNGQELLPADAVEYEKMVKDIQVKSNIIVSPQEIQTMTEVASQMKTYVQVKDIVSISKPMVPMVAAASYKTAGAFVASCLASPAAPIIATFLLAAAGIYVATWLGRKQAEATWEKARVPQLGHFKEMNLDVELMSYFANNEIVFDKQYFPAIQGLGARTYSYKHNWGNSFSVRSKVFGNKNQQAIFENQDKLNFILEIKNKYVEYEYGWGGLVTTQTIKFDDNEDYYLQFESMKRLSTNQQSDGIVTDIKTSVLKRNPATGLFFEDFSFQTFNNIKVFDYMLHNEGIEFRKFNVKVKEIFGEGFSPNMFDSKDFCPGKSTFDPSWCVPGKYPFGNPKGWSSPTTVPTHFPPAIFKDVDKVQSGSHSTNTNIENGNKVHENMDKNQSTIKPGDPIPNPKPPESIYPDLEKPVYPEPEPGPDPPGPDPDPNPDPGPAPDIPKLDFSPLYVDLKDKFPFCVPFDLIEWVGLLEAEQKEPKFTVVFPAENFKTKTDSEMELDYGSFTEWIDIFRFFIMIAFVVYLIVITKNIIK